MILSYLFKQNKPSYTVLFFIAILFIISTFSCSQSSINYNGDNNSTETNDDLINNPYGHNIGINLFASQLDWTSDRLFADVMKTARDWTAADDSYGHGALVEIDENGWPKTDAECVIWHGIDKMNGAYYLEGECAASPSISTGYGNSDIVDFKYSNVKFSARLVYHSTDGSGLLLTFKNTNGGVRNVKLMRPLTPGNVLSYSIDTTFTTQSKKLVEKFQVVRFMWLVDAWNGAWQVSWSDRVKPTYCSFNRGGGSTPDIGWAGKGAAWECAIQFANETGKDIWINMPLGANDDYIRELASLIKNTYTKPGGKIYWEYSNEATWDMTGVCANYLRTKGLEEGAAGGPISYDDQTNDPNVLSARYYTKRAAEMSLVWRSVWGDENMTTRVRPIACGQLSYDSELIWGLEFVHNWFGNGDGDHVATPHPVNYFFYGCGASHYSGDNPAKEVTTDVKEIEKFESYEEEEACLAKMYGLKRCAYEGGVWTSASDYQLPRISEAMTRYHDLWNKYDNDLFVYYVTTGGEDNGTALGFTSDTFNLDTQKYSALNTILSRPKTVVTAGKLAPCVIAAADFSVNSVPWLHPAPGDAQTSGGLEFNQWSTFKGYLFRTDVDCEVSITLIYNETAGANIEIMVDGAVISKEIITGTTSPVYKVNLKKGLHGLRVKKIDPGYFFLKEIAIQ